MVHIGICATNGFRIPIPYLIKDLGDMIYELDTPEHNTLPGSINMDFNADEDSDILESTEDFTYWWNITDAEVEIPRVTRHVINSHFYAYFHAVS